MTITQGIERMTDSLTLEEKVALLTGRDFWNTIAVERIGLRNMLLSDGPSGVRGERWDEREPSLNLPSSTALASSWSRDLATRYGDALGSQARGKGVDVVLGPTINLHRSPYGGRHFECLSEDPLLSGELAAAYVRGLQARGVAATPKHYVANDFETDRFTVDVVVDERPLRELYLRPFEHAVVDGGAWAVMSGYNSINGATATENDLLETPLRTEWGFDGVVISDWTAVRSLHSATKEQDLAMPGPDGPWGQALVDAVRSGDIDEATIDRKVARLLLLAARVGAITLDGQPPRVAGGPSDRSGGSHAPPPSPAPCWCATRQSCPSTRPPSVASPSSARTPATPAPRAVAARRCCRNWCPRRTTHSPPPSATRCVLRGRCRGRIGRRRAAPGIDDQPGDG